MGNIKVKLQSKKIRRDKSFSIENNNSIKNEKLKLFNATVVLRLLDYIDEQCLTQRNLAKLLEVSPQYINKLLRGKELNLKVETILKWENALGITLIKALEVEPEPLNSVVYTFNSIQPFYLDIVDNGSGDDYTKIA